MEPAAPASTAAVTDASLTLGVQLCFALYSTMLGMNRVYRKALRDLDITYVQYLVMLVLWERDGVNVSEICQRLFLETTTVTPLLKRLEARGLISRQRLAADERNVIIRLTPAGVDLKAKAASVPACIASAMGCSSEDITALRERLEALRSQLFAQP